MLIGHISDLHMLPDGQLLAGKLDVNQLARTAVDTLNHEALRPGFVLVTGDLTHNGSLEEMQHARAMLDRLTMPYYALRGDHDDPDAFHQVFQDRGWQEGAASDVRYVVDDFDVRLLVIDSTTTDHTGPSFGPERCQWLDAALSAADKPTIIALHHPPFGCRIPVGTYVRDPDAKWANELKEVVSRHSHVKLVACGHVHRSIQRCWAGTRVAVCPSTCVQTDPDFGDFVASAQAGRRNFTLVMEPPALHALWWDGEAIATYTLPTSRSYPRQR